MTKCTRCRCASCEADRKALADNASAILYVASAVGACVAIMTKATARRVLNDAYARAVDAGLDTTWLASLSSKKTR